MIVPDASTVVEVLLQTERGRRLETRLFAPEETRHVPHLLDIEVAHALRRAWLQGLINTATLTTSSCRAFGRYATT